MFRKQVEAWGRLSQAQQVATLVITFTLAFGILVGIFADPGPPGPAGPQGQTGRQGETGPQGERGETGEQGEKGNRGDKGSRGDPGPRGERGLTGRAGAPAPTVAPIPTLAPTPTPTPTMEVSEDARTTAIAGIMLYPAVMDAAIFQKGSALSLVIVVGYATNEEYSKQLGGNFVRMVKNMSQDDPPGRAIGTGIYDYLITVIHPNGDRVALGAKVSTSARITW